MNGMLKRLSTVPMLALTMWACENVGELTQPALEPANDVHRVLITLEKQGTTVVRETDFTVGTVSGVIGENGGELNLANRVVLRVPAGAVAGPTVFSMSKLDGDHLQVDLTATKLLPNDVGAAGFAVPVELTFNYAAAQELPADLGKLKVFYINPLGGSEAQPTVVDVTGMKVTGSLQHFSPYGVGWAE